MLFYMHQRVSWGRPSMIIFMTFSVRYDGQEKSLATDLTTVGDLLESLGIELGPLDAVDPAPEFSIDSAIFK